MADYDHHRRVTQQLWEQRLADSNGDDERPLSDEYSQTYTASPGVDNEHELDVAKAAELLRHLPDFWRYLQRQVASEGELASLDAGAGEAAKSSGIARYLINALAPRRFVLHAEEPSRKQRGKIGRGAGALEINIYPQTIQDLLDALGVGELRLEPRPSYITCFHVAYYLKQEQGTIPVLARLAELVGDDGLVLFIIEGPGQLQEMKQFMRATRGLGEPASTAMILRTLEQAGIPYGDPPIRIPNTSWRVDKTCPPAEMFYRDFEFLLDGNDGNNRPLDWDDYQAAGGWMQEHAIADGDGGWCLDGGDDLIVAGRWLAAHPADMAVARAMGRMSLVPVASP